MESKNNFLKNIGIFFGSIFAIVLSFALFWFFVIKLPSLFLDWVEVGEDGQKAINMFPIVIAVVFIATTVIISIDSKINIKEAFNWSLKYNQGMWLLGSGLFFASLFRNSFLREWFDILTKNANGIAILISCVIIYFLPSLIASMRKHHNSLAIFFLNILLGWTVLGWIVSMIWSGTAVKISAE